MKTYSLPSSRGVALIIVLAFLVLISGLTVAFLSSVTTELALSKTTANSATTVQLANSSVNLVMAQIVDATKGQDSSGQTLAWASQPGMIRTFLASGSANYSYKLYSSGTMVAKGQVTDVPPPDWNSATKYAGLYCDLNAPVLVSDSNGAIKPDTASPDTYSAVYPIVDPMAQGPVDGFSVTTPPGYTGANPPAASYDPTTALLSSTSANTSNPAPMPVQWLYVLRDGTVTSGSASVSGSSVAVAKASKSNPITGRVAFWADDETCKVNINTASEGTYWDVPRIYSAEDYGTPSGGTPGFASCQPVQHEYQRYPGHPATTCLSPVFKSWLPLNPTNPSSAELDPYYNIAPRVGLKNNGGGGGSKGGSHQVPESDTSLLTNGDTDRLYASVDELMFTPVLSGTGVGAPRIPNTSTAGAPTKPNLITKDVLEKTRFFITANSVAPETTLYNTPRVAVWPVWGPDTDSAKVAYRTTYDKLLAFCSTIGGKGYFFTRSNPRSQTADYTGRNVDLYQYLHALTKTDVPGFGGNFLKKYGADCDQILTYIFDYIRCTNLQDRSTGAHEYTQLYPNSGAGEALPIKIGNTQGFGRFMSISSANLLFYGTAGTAAISGTATKMKAVFFVQFASPMHGNGAKRSKTKYIVAGLNLLKTGTTPMGFPLVISGTNVTNGTNHLDIADLSIWHGRDVCGTEHALEGLLGGSGTTCKSTYPFISSEIPVPAGPTFSISEAADVTVRILPEEAADTDPGAVIQTIHLKFPAGTFKNPGFNANVPTNSEGPTIFTIRNLVGSETGVRSLVHPRDTVIAVEVAGANGNIADSTDDPTAGDNRLVESLSDVPATRFRAHKDYGTAGVQYAHGLLMSVGERFWGGTYGPLVPMPTGRTGFLSSDPSPMTASWSAWTGKMYVNPSNSVPQYRQPNVPSRVPASTGVQRKDGGPGDWDTGFGDQPDGAYCNKSDEGDTRTGPGILPYMFGYGQGTAAASSTYFSPNRQIPSPMILGSIPTGVQRELPWQTLLFHPRPEDPAHPGNASPKDHLLADLFWMPVVEPYAISQPFATNGKINLNYQIAPFTYINRSTGMYAVMKSTKFLALSVNDSSKYKPRDYSGRDFTIEGKRRSIDMVKTLADFDAKFKSNEVFKSASQICEMNLVPSSGEVASSSNMAAFWTNNKLTGDNMREKPYADLYSRLTTKSNTYTVHMCVQTLKKSPSTDATVFVDPNGSSKGARDTILSEYRGSAIIERYIDVNDPALPDFASLYANNPTDPKLNIDQYYKFRVVSTKRFAP